MDIQKTLPADLPAVMKIYAGARDFMAASGNPNQWGPWNWPPEDVIQKDIAAGKSYVCRENGEILAVFYYDWGERIDPTYDRIENGAWIGGETYGVVHRIAVRSQGKGVGAFCLRWALKQSGHLRIDTHEDNTPMQAMLKKLGFVYCGVIDAGQDHGPRLAFEKVE